VAYFLLVFHPNPIFILPDEYIRLKGNKMKIVRQFSVLTVGWKFVRRL
jgi:hypothetical protein